MKQILFVDDEENILHGLKRMLRPMRHEWEMSFARGGQEAIELISHNSFSAVITDMRMPKIDGAKVLEFVKSHNPDISRIVLSGQTDKEDILRSTGVAHQFIAKPCDTEQLKKAVSRSCQLRDLLSNEKVAIAAGGIDVLPSLPEIYLELTREMQSAEVSVNKITEIVSKDIAMSAKVLQLANSSFFGLAHQVETVHQGIMVLGLDVIRSLTLMTTVFKSFECESQTTVLNNLWQHSFIVSAVAEAIAKSENADRYCISQAQQAGVLHDIGKLILATSMNKEFIQACVISESANISQNAAEQKVFGCDHGQVGAFLLGLWGLPDGIVEAVAFHHNPALSHSQEGVFSPLAAIHIANTTVNQCIEDGTANSKTSTLDTEWLKKCGVIIKEEHWINITRKTIGMDDLQ